MALPNKPIPPEMVAQIALGMQEPVDIAYQFGFSASEYRSLEQHKPFIADVMAKRAELERGGQTVKVKAAWMAENLLDDLFLKAKSPDASIAQVQETVKIMAKLGDLEPKGAQQIQAGPGFSVQIIIPQTTTAHGKVIEAQTTTIAFPTFDKPADTSDATDITPTESTDDDRQDN